MGRIEALAKDEEQKEVVLASCTVEFSAETLYRYTSRTVAAIKAVWPEWMPIQEPEVRISFFNKERWVSAA